MTNLDSIFAPVGAIKEPEKKVSAEFNPSAKNSKTGVYKAVVKFLPWHANPEKSIMRKTQCYVVDPVTQKGRYMDSLRNVGQQCPILNTFWNIYNTNNKQLQDFAKKYLSNGETFTSLVQVISDEQHPELVGRILPWRFKKTVWEKMYNEQHPQVGIAHNPFDIINGRYFSVYVVLKNGWNNYDNCQFFDFVGENGEPSSMLMLGPDNQYRRITAQTDRQSVYNYLVTNSPDLSAYDHREWSAEDTQYVNGVIQSVTNYVQTGNMGAVPTMSSNPVVSSTPMTNPVVNEVANVVPQTFTNNVPGVTNPVQPMTPPQVNLGQVNVSQPAPITGIDLPDVQLPPTPQMSATPNMGMDLGDLYKNL